MKRIATIAALITFAATPPAVAQWAGMPAWNNPKGGTGVTINGDLGFPNNNGGKGTAFGARATLGLANISLTAGVSSWKPKGFRIARRPSAARRSSRSSAAVSFQWP